MHRPPRLRAGDTIGVLAPAGPAGDTVLSRGTQLLVQAGFRVALGRALREQKNYLAGTDAARLDDLLAMAGDRSIAAILAARGGYGCGRLLPAVDASVFQRRPLALVGHSDLTFLLNHLTQRARLVTFHGPMLSQLAERPERIQSLLALLAGEPQPPIDAPRVLRAGAAKGRLVGGCLSIVAAMCGTPYALKTRGRLLFLEDVNEAPFRIDRMLTQLKHAGALNGVAALLFGEMPGCFTGSGATLEDVVSSICDNGSYPIVAGLPSGHGRGTLTLPLGAAAQLCGARLSFLEPAVT